MKLTRTYYLGANTKDGFFSLYDGFAAGDKDFLHMIKGGPGTGKSGFMRRIGEAAEERGLDVEYVLCSGDPDSLDGVYIPSMHLGFMDATAPHAADPDYFAVSGDYLNIGRFCETPMCETDRDRVRRLTREYRAHYETAYTWLAAAHEAKLAAAPKLMTEAGRERLFRRVERILDDCPAVSSSAPNAQRRFISAISCKGCVRADSFSCDMRVYGVESSCGFAPELLSHITVECRKRGLSFIECPSPLSPTDTEAVILPEAGIVFFDGRLADDCYQRIRCDAEIPINALKAHAKEIEEGRKLSEKLTALAVNRLSRAKLLHDELEHVYHPYVDFAALTKFTDEYIEKLFEEC